MPEHLEIISACIRERKVDDTIPAVQAAIDAGLEPAQIIKQGMIPAMDVVGEEFSAGTIFVPEMLVSAMLLKKGLELVKPLLEGEKIDDQGVVLIGTVKGDIHDIGKNIVVMMLESAGFDVVDLGVDLSVEQVVSQVSERRPHILGLSALLTTTMPEMGRVIAALEEAGLRDQVKILVGGAPIDQTFADSIEADGYARDAGEAVKLARQIFAG